ncbi:serine/threonine-protein kinase RIPK-like [Phoenix dactylifera]|uniref:Serine/threonine-protein kinase RIPK-like n=1 Tax=Phoenix dactylifera TaxID=42345 RepID=A0A8B7D596_PHODC|nr:serine/threonine-protein kinase RIPK-like [Phoenix dactylifera]XP_017702377.2 serine/threonine-protein kinase RIPK-like [Phoenix dactylifera]XP_038973892.1 serine/threonine-protein kinase RIPK-like [Phoenix dactylifera]
MIIEKVASDEEKGEGSCILVGLSLDANGRELLDWALSKVAKQDDRVVAVHVCRNSELCNTSTFSLIKVLDEYLAVYEGLCNLKKVALVGRVSPGSSIRRVLVKEAKLCGARTAVVGVHNNYSFGGSASLAKYCAKKLPPTTNLIAIHNGKVIFQREATKTPSGGDPKSTLRNVLHPSVSMDAKIIVPSSKVKLDKGSPRISSVGYRCGLNEEVSKDHSLGKMAEVGPVSISVLVRRLPEQRPGWPLLRRAVSENLQAPKDDEARKMSVVQWAMNLPKRVSPSNQPRMDLIKELKVILGTSTSTCKWFQYEELQNSTNQFSSENLIGKGGSSQVYKGCLPDGQHVAIKLSKLSAEASRDFLLEVDIMTKLQHKLMVPLMGICVEDNHLISVYSYFSKGSLEENLHGKRTKAPLPWDMRFKVAMGIAEALSYLHNGCSRPVIHRDVKSSNILLNDEFEPQLSDFGLAMWAPTTSAYVTHGSVVGTFGYLAPEYFMYGKVSEKIDVYAFGVVLLELLSGRKPISDDNPEGQESLVMWATPILERGDVMNLLDPNLDLKHDEVQMRRMVLAASLCITRAARLRPQMSQIQSLLQGVEDMEAWMNCLTDTATLNELDCQDEETYPASSIGSHLGLALLDVEDDASVTSFEQSQLGSLEEYLRGRWSRSSSFD